MKNKLYRHALAGYTICFAFLGLSGCVGDSGGNNAAGSPDANVTENFNYSAMLANYADNIIQPAYRTAAQGASELASNDIPVLCEAVGTEQEAQALAAARAAWRALMRDWQRAELFIVGPAADNSNAMRNAIYSYASSSPPSSCAVDQSVVLAQDAAFDIGSRSFNSRGLDALEYLLFNTNLEHTCPIQITETQNWNSLTETARKSQRCEYAEKVANDVSASIQQLLSRWEIAGGNYRMAFVNPANNADTLAALSDALFYIEKETKDLKLGLPTGIHADCRAAACPAAVESAYSDMGLDNIKQNLLAFRDGLLGGEGLGFDDIIVAEGYASVVSAFLEEIDLALEIIAQSETGLLQQSQQLLAADDSAACANAAANADVASGVSICRLHGALKRITDRLRIDFIAIVNLDLPERGQSDND